MWQSVGQLQSAYRHGADTILANSTAKLFMGPITDEATRNHLTGLLGDELASEKQTTLDARTRQPTSRRVNHRLLPKTDAAALQQLSGHRAVLIDGNLPPAVVRLQPWWQRR